MTRIARHMVAGLAALVIPLGADRVAAEPSTLDPGVLTVCLPRNSGVIAGMRSSGGTGFDYRVSQELATRLGLSLSAVWFENELEEESDPVRETYAMLSYGLCDIVPGHPRYVRAVGEPGFSNASVPRWVNMPQEIDRDTEYLKDRQVGFVPVQPISVSRGYMRAGLSLAYLEGTPEPADLSDLEGRVLAFQQGTLSGAIAMLQLSAQDKRRARHFNPGAMFLWEVEARGLDLAIVDVSAFDTYRNSNPITRMKLAAWRHPFGMDLGVAALESNSALLAEIDEIFRDMLQEGFFVATAEAEGLTYMAPRSEALAQELSLKDLKTSQ